jgi:phenylacetate-CoA ligase
MTRTANLAALRPSPLPTFDGGRVRALAGQMIDRERWSGERLRAYQQHRLYDTIAHAITHSPYYRDTIGQAVRGGIALEQLPVLTKATLMREFDRVVTDCWLRLADVEEHLAGERAGDLILGEYRAFASGGTTGQRGVFLYDRQAWDVSIANLLRWKRAVGDTPETRFITIGAPSALHITHRVSAEVRAGRPDVPNLAVTTPLPEIVAALNAYRPESLLTYPSFIRQLAEEQRAGRLQIAPLRFLSAAEVLTQDVRDLVRDTWGADVFDCYGATEAALIGSECQRHAGIHISDDLVVLEVVDRDNRPVPPGVSGDKVLVTPLFNRALPLIRYELSDRVMLADGLCPCGRPHRRLATIEGRREDVLRLPARRGGQVDLHPRRLRSSLLRLPAVRQYQVVAQPNTLRVRVVLRDSDGAAALPDIWRIVQAELDKIGAVAGSLAIEPVDRIDRSGPAAKERLVSAAG